jgi:hypothetical protein
MVINGTWKEHSLSLSIKSNSLTLSLQSKGGASLFFGVLGGATESRLPKHQQIGTHLSKGGSEVYSFDGEGRVWTAMLEGVSYRRGLNGKTVAKWQEPGNGAASDERGRRWLAPAEAGDLQEHARQIAASLYAALSQGKVALQSPLPEAALPLLERAAFFNRARYQQDVLAYHRVYRPVGILPPDQYMAVVLQATEGCSFNTCTFCNFYRDRRFRIKPAEEFRQHALAVKKFLGEGLALRRTIFLGDANALVTPMPRLVETLKITRDVFDVERLGGIYAFLDGFSGEKKSAKEYAALARLGMKRIYIGMESGCEELLRFLKKPGKPGDVLQAVQAIKAGGLSVGLIVLLGAGGHFYAPIHVRETVAALNAMPLDLDDLVYFSELIESEGMEYTQLAFQQDLRPLSSAERVAQGEEIERQLKFSEKRGVPHISRYDIREFVY